jgi:hypothetical protein
MQGKLSDDVRNLLGISEFDSSATKDGSSKAATDIKTSVPNEPRHTPADDSQPKAKELQVSPDGDAIGMDEFAQWEEQANELATTRYRRASDRYKGEERRGHIPDAAVGKRSTPVFPDLAVVVYEPVAVVSGSIAELFDNFDIPVTEPSNYNAFKIALEQASIKDAFTVAILGAESDEDLNASRVQELRSEHTDKPLVFLSNLDLSQLRRRILHAGASYFIQKPDADSPNLVSLQIIRKRFLDDLLLFVSECHARYIAVYEALNDIEA